MPVDYGLLSANLNLPIEQMVQIKTQQDAERARLGLAYAAMRNQQSQASAANSMQRIQSENAQIAADKMQSQKLTAEKAMQEAQLKQRQEDALLPYSQMTEGQRVQQMGYQDAEKERQFMNHQKEMEYSRALSNDAAKQKYEMAKLDFDKNKPESPEAKFAYDLARETDPQKRQFMIDQRNLERARNNESITYNKDGSTTILRGANAGQGQGFSNKLKEEQTADDKAMSDLQQIRTLWRPLYSTSGGHLWEEGKGWVARKGAALIIPESEKQDYAQYAQWKGLVDQNFLKYKTEVTGSAGPLTEMNRIEKAIYSAKNDPIAFKAAMDQAEDKFKRYTAIRKQALTNGLEPGTPAFGQYIEASGWATPAKSSQNKSGDVFAGSRFERK